MNPLLHVLKFQGRAECGNILHHSSLFRWMGLPLLTVVVPVNVLASVM